MLLAGSDDDDDEEDEKEESSAPPVDISEPSLASPSKSKYTLPRKTMFLPPPPPPPAAPPAEEEAKPMRARQLTGTGMTETPLYEASDSGKGGKLKTSTNRMAAIVRQKILADKMREKKGGGENVGARFAAAASAAAAASKA